MWEIEGTWSKQWQLCVREREMTWCCAFYIFSQQLFASGLTKMLRVFDRRRCVCEREREREREGHALGPFDETEGVWGNSGCRCDVICAALTNKAWRIKTCPFVDVWPGRRGGPKDNALRRMFNVYIVLRSCYEGNLISHWTAPTLSHTILLRT